MQVFAVLKRAQGYKAQTTRTVVIQRASNKLALRTYIVQCNMCKDFKNSKLRDLVSQQNLSQTKIMSNNAKKSC